MFTTRLSGDASRLWMLTFDLLLEDHLSRKGEPAEQRVLYRHRRNMGGRYNILIATVACTSLDLQMRAHAMKNQTDLLHNLPPSAWVDGLGAENPIVVAGVAVPARHRSQSDWDTTICA